MENFEKCPHCGEVFVPGKRAVPLSGLGEIRAENYRVAQQLVDEGKISEVWAQRFLSDNPALLSGMDWSYYPGGVGVTAMELSFNGINVSSVLYGQDLYQAIKLTGEKKKELQKWTKKGLSVQRALEKVGIQSYVLMSNPGAV